LQLRLEQARQDPRYAFLFRAQPFPLALASFLRLLLGVEPAHNFDTGRPPWADSYEGQYPTAALTHRITILDLSQLASEVLENVTALLGRLVFEFMQRNPNRAEFPVVLILEEAHHYIPAHAHHERQQRARDVFEKIAKEGRKFGLSLLVASQRPSELSRTVLAQCNSFIVHRIQNPDDQEYFRSVISGINRELLDQLPSLAQQQAIVLGDCVRLPLQVRINSVEPRPHSRDPEFVARWSATAPTLPDFEGIAARWQGETQ
jgi:DNA helicase HerA-like ATPase